MTTKKSEQNKKKKKKKPGPHEELKWETARELGLHDELAKSGKNLSVREAGKLGGQMVKKLIQRGKVAMAEDTQINTTPNKEDDQEID